MSALHLSRNTPPSVRNVEQALRPLSTRGGGNGTLVAPRISLLTTFGVQLSNQPQLEPAGLAPKSLLLPYYLMCVLSSRPPCSLRSPAAQLNPFVVARCPIENGLTCTYPADTRCIHDWTQPFWA